MTSQQKRQLREYIINSDPDRAVALLNSIDTTIGTRTKAQNDSIHLWLDMVAEELDKNGHTVQNVVAKIQKAEIRPTGKNLKEVMWRPYQIAALGKDSTTKLNKLEVDRVYEGLNKFIGEHFKFHIPFPSDEQKQLENLGGYKTAAGQGTEGVDYPEYNGKSSL
jgi:hypothetical protein